MINQEFNGRRLIDLFNDYEVILNQSKKNLDDVLNELNFMSKQVLTLNQVKNLDTKISNEKNKVIELQIDIQDNIKIITKFIKLNPFNENIKLNLILLNELSIDKSVFESLIIDYKNKIFQELRDYLYKKNSNEVKRLSFISLNLSFKSTSLLTESLKKLQSINEKLNSVINEVVVDYFSIRNFQEKEYINRFTNEISDSLIRLQDKYENNEKMHKEALESELNKLKDNFKTEIEKKIIDSNKDIEKFKKTYIIDKENLIKKMNQANTSVLNIEKIINQTQDKSFDLNKNIDNANNKINELIHIKSEELNKELIENIGIIKSTIDAKLSEITNFYDDAKRHYKSFAALAEKAGDYELTQYYLKKAKEEKQDFKKYRTFTTISMIFAIIATIFVLLIPIFDHWINPSATQNSDYYYSTISRFAVSIVFFILALYLSRQSAKHYECYQENYNTYLQLATIEPFISGLSEEDKIVIRKELVHVYFGQKIDGKYASKGDEVSTLTGLIQPIVERLTKNSSTDLSK